MYKKNLIIFIDSFPFSDLEKTKFLSTFKNKAKVRPGFGYSVNIKAEIFGGYLPDQLGYFCEWQYDRKSSFRKYGLILFFLSLISKNYYLDRIFHKIISRVINCSLINIPFGYMKYFRKENKLAYEDDFSFPTIFSKRSSFVKILDSDFEAGEERDKKIFDKAKEMVKKNDQENFFVASVDLDHITHRYGVDSKEHIDKIMELDKYIEETCDLFKKKNPDGNIIILSDHGMADVNNIIDINLEEKFGKVGERSYIYFTEATMLRIWTFNNSLNESIQRYFRELDCGKIVEKEERINFGITSSEFGDIIFLLNEGNIFLPSFYARRKALKALHGYDPDSESQAGILLTDSRTLTKDKFKTIELYIFLTENLFNNS